ncbi:MAG: response regulator transcription factor [Bryobacteraceae bacterium]|nr:response regulator transcription factor [Bryobacteraceae bacterium]
MRVLLIDDDVELCGLLGELLRREGNEVEARHDGLSGLEAARSGAADIVILDAGLPRLDGFGVLRKLRETSRIPVLMLTARGEDVDRIVGLELGADDYLPKPFNPRELTARLRAILRRTEDREDSAGRARIEINGVRLDPGSRSVTVDGSPAALTTFEFDVLHALMKAAGRVLTRDDLMEAIYQRKSTPFDRAIDVHISNLRRKLETDRVLIRTVRGIGYQFCRTPEESE